MGIIDSIFFWIKDFLQDYSIQVSVGQFFRDLLKWILINNMFENSAYRIGLSIILDFIIKKYTRNNY